MNLKLVSMLSTRFSQGNCIPASAERRFFELSLLFLLLTERGQNLILCRCVLETKLVLVIENSKETFPYLEKIESGILI